MHRFLPLCALLLALSLVPASLRAGDEEEDERPPVELPPGWQLRLTGEQGTPVADYVEDTRGYVEIVGREQDGASEAEGGPGSQHEAHGLPIGFLDLWWGVNVEIAQLVRGPMEPMADGNTEVLMHYWEELSDVGPSRVRYTFFRGRLLSAELWFPEEFSRQTPSEVVSRMAERWGNYEEFKGSGRYQRTPVAWRWADGTTEVVLHWDPEQQIFRQVRSSLSVRDRMDEQQRMYVEEERNRRLEALTRDY